MTVGEKIRKMRELNHFSQAQMAEKLNMSVNGYAKIERGESKVYIDKLEKIAQVFDMDLTELLAINDKSVICVISDNNDNAHSFNYYQNGYDENEKLHLMIEHQKELLGKQQALLEEKERLIEQQKQQIQTLAEIAELLKKQ